MTWNCLKRLIQCSSCFTLLLTCRRDKHRAQAVAVSPMQIISLGSLSLSPTHCDACYLSSFSCPSFIGHMNYILIKPLLSSYPFLPLYLTCALLLSLLCSACFLSVSLSHASPSLTVEEKCLSKPTRHTLLTWNVSNCFHSTGCESHATFRCEKCTFHQLVWVAIL